MKHNVNVPLVLSQEQHERVVAVFALLIEIDKRLNGKKKKAKKSKSKSKDREIYTQKNRRLAKSCGPFLLPLLSNNAKLLYL